MTEPQRDVFTFYTDDPDPESIMYGCTAATLEEAETLVRAAGYREFTLYEQRALSPDETTDAANERILGNPFLGPQWLPLVETIELLTRQSAYGQVLDSDDLLCGLWPRPVQVAVRASHARERRIPSSRSQRQEH